MTNDFVSILNWIDHSIFCAWPDIRSKSFSSKMKGELNSFFVLLFTTFITSSSTESSTLELQAIDVPLDSMVVVSQPQVSTK